MPITFNSQGGFLNGTISSSNGDMFLFTSGSVGKISLGEQLELTGSKIIEKDTTGQIRRIKTFESDDSVTIEEFKASESVPFKTTKKNPTTGKETFQSASNIGNQIDFIQKDGTSQINLSASINPRINIIDSQTNKKRMLRGESDYYYFTAGAGTGFLSTGVDDEMNYYIAPNTGVFNNSINIADADKFLKVSQSGDVVISGKLFAQEYHTEFVSSSILLSSGSTIFGNTTDDTHTFIGKFVNAITASADISSSSEIIANSIGVDGTIFHSNDTDTKIVFTNDVITISAGNEQLIQLQEGAQDKVIIGDGGDVDFHVKAGGDNTLFAEGSSQRIGIGTATPSSKLQVSGDVTTTHITASGNISASGALFVNGITSSADIYGEGHIYLPAGGANKGFLILNADDVVINSGFPSDDYISYSSVNDGITIKSNHILLDATAELGIGNNSPPEKLTVEGNISASGDVVANSGSFNYITASIVDVDGDTIRFGGEPFTKANIQTLKLGRSLKPLRPGRSKPDVDGDDGVFEGNITASGDISSSGKIIGKDSIFHGTTLFGSATQEGIRISDGTTTGLISINDESLVLQGSTSDPTNDTHTPQMQIDPSANVLLRKGSGAAAPIGGNFHAEGNITASGNISASGEYIGNHIQIYNSNFQDDIATTVHFVPVGTNNFEQTTEDADEVGFVAPYDGELVKIIYRHNFDASSTSTRWLMSIIADGTDMAGTATMRFRASVTGASTDTIKEITVADADTEGLSNMTFSKGESIFIQIRNSADVTDTSSEFHVTVVLKFNIPLGLI